MKVLFLDVFFFPKLVSFKIGIILGNSGSSVDRDKKSSNGNIRRRGLGDTASPPSREKRTMASSLRFKQVLEESFAMSQRRLMMFTDAPDAFPSGSPAREENVTDGAVGSGADGTDDYDPFFGEEAASVDVSTV